MNTKTDIKFVYNDVLDGHKENFGFHVTIFQVVLCTLQGSAVEITCVLVLSISIDDDSPRS